MSAIAFRRQASLWAVAMVALAIELAGCQPEKSPDVSPPPGKTPTEVPSDDRRELVVAISIDIPPYVMNQTTSGLEIDVLHEALPEYKLRFLQMSYAELQTAIQDDKSDVSAGVHRTDDGGIYSRGFVSFANYAITKKSATQKIDNIADLQGHVVLTWEDADEELGPQFQKLFGPGGSDEKDYEPIADQTEQVKQFWAADDKVIVIDGAIFSYVSRELGYSLDDVEFHAIFPPVTNLTARFQSEQVRDQFNQGLTKLCQSGEYQNLLDKYGIKLKSTVCESLND